MSKFLIKTVSGNVSKELNAIDFSSDYAKEAEEKFINKTFKIFGLRTPAANILKQTCLSLGFDCAVSKDTVTCKAETTDVLINATVSGLKKLSLKLKNQPFGLPELSNDIIDFIREKEYFKIGKYEFSKKEPLIMGILNVTPDSFSDGGKYINPENALRHSEEMINDGAKIIDIGGESTRPGSLRVSVNEELERILPVLKKLRKEFPDILLSVDTLNPQTAKIAINEGADIINTVAAPEVFCEIFDDLKTNNISFVVTHSGKIPPDKDICDFDGDIVEHIFKFFDEKTKTLDGINLILDPGIGFDKSVNDNFALIKRAEEFLHCDYPILYGISRKSFLTKTFPDISPDELTGFYHGILIQKGVNILRVHNTNQTADIINLYNKLQG